MTVELPTDLAAAVMVLLSHSGPVLGPFGLEVCECCGEVWPCPGREAGVRDLLWSAHR